MNKMMACETISNYLVPLIFFGKSYCKHKLLSLPIQSCDGSGKHLNRVRGVGNVIKVTACVQYCDYFMMAKKTCKRSFT